MLYYSLIPSLNKYSLSAYYVAGAVLDTGKQHEQNIRMPAHMKLTLYWQIMKVHRNQLGTHCNNPGKNGEHWTEAVSREKEAEFLKMQN